VNLFGVSDVAVTCHLFKPLLFIL